MSKDMTEILMDFERGIEELRADNMRLQARVSTLEYQMTELAVKDRDLRDYYAGQALVGLLQGDIVHGYMQVAIDAFELADAMMAARDE